MVKTVQKTLSLTPETLTKLETLRREAYKKIDKIGTSKLVRSFIRYFDENPNEFKELLGGKYFDDL